MEQVRHLVDEAYDAVPISTTAGRFPVLCGQVVGIEAVKTNGRQRLCLDCLREVRLRISNACIAGFTGTAMSAAQLGLHLKAQGQEQAEAAADVQAWRGRFVEAVGKLLLYNPNAQFTSEDVIDRVGLPRPDGTSNANNAVGAMMTGLAKRGVIRKTSTRRPSTRTSSHGREIAVWCKA